MGKYMHLFVSSGERGWRKVIRSGAFGWTFSILGYGNDERRGKGDGSRFGSKERREAEIQSDDSFTLNWCFDLPR